MCRFKRLKPTKIEKAKKWNMVQLDASHEWVCNQDYLYRVMDLKEKTQVEKGKKSISMILLHSNVDSSVNRVWKLWNKSFN